MKIISIEPTPSPNSMKLNMDEALPPGSRHTYTKDDAGDPAVPEPIRKLLAAEGVKSIFHAADFVAVDRTPKGDWQTILAQARELFGEAQPGSEGAPFLEADADSQPAFGEAQVLLQTFRGIPLQVRVRAGSEEARVAMPERFAEAAIRAGTASPNLIKERKLEELGVRYGELKDIAGEVVQELDASYDAARLESLVSAAMQETPSSAPDAADEADSGATAEKLRAADWKLRYAALQTIKPSLETLHLLAQAAQDEHVSVRRLATVYLGDIKEPEVLPYLYRALEDDSPVVRRTAGDTLSDLGDPAAAPAMARALKDRNKLVRWRAARFLYEAGDESALQALREAADDPEFEVRMQVKIALERIEGGRAAEGSVWQQMTRRNE